MMSDIILPSDSKLVVPNDYKYFDAKLSLRGRTYNMISDNDKDSLISTGQKVTVNGNIVSRLVGHFFDN